MTSSLLGSWIDLEAATSAARELCPPEFLPAEESSLPLPVAALALGDFHLADDYKIDRYPVVQGSAPAPGMRARLTEIRNRAAKAGLLGQGIEPPVLDARGASIEPVLSPLSPSPSTVGADQAGEEHPPTAKPDDQAVFPSTPTQPQSDSGEDQLRSFVPPLGPLNFRARALADWLRENFDPTAVFICDAQGGSLVEFDVSGDLIAGAIVLADAATRARRHLPGGQASPGCALHAEIGPASTLSLVSSSTRLGVFHVGLTARAPLNSQATRTVCRALRKTIEFEG